MSYNKQSKKDFPYALSFLILPLILNTDSIEHIDKRTKSLHHWINKNKDKMIGFRERCLGLTPITKETLIFLLQHDFISINKYGNFILNQTKIFNKPIENTELRNYIKKSEIIGNLFSKAGTLETIFTILGVKP